MQNLKNFIKRLWNSTSGLLQLFIGLAISLLIGTVVLLTGQSPFLALLGVSIFAAFKEHHCGDLTGEFHWRNFFLLLLPAILLYIIFF